MDNNEETVNNIIELSNNLRLTKNKIPVHVTSVYMQSLSQMLRDGNSSTFHRAIIADLIVVAFPELAQAIKDSDLRKESA